MSIFNLKNNLSAHIILTFVFVIKPLKRVYLMKKAYLILFLIASTAFVGCQKDIPVLGQEDGDVTAKSAVFIRAITLHTFPERDPSTTLTWDSGSFQTFDTTDSIGPDIFFSLYHKSDEGLIMSFTQPSHFVDVLPLNADTPLIYYFTEPFQILPEYIDSTFYLKVNDLEIVDPVNNVTLMDSLPFTIGPDLTHPEDPYPSSFSSTGFNGCQVTLSLEWK